MVDTNHDEHELVTKAINGETDAFGELYKRYLDAIYRFVYFRTGHNEDAEDLTEQTFLKAWEALPKYRQVGKPFSSWLYRIAYNVVVDYHRHNKKVEGISQELIRESILIQPQGTLKNVEDREEITNLARAITKLSEEQQMVIIFRFIEGMSYKQVSEIIGKNEGTCRMIQFRALTALQNILSKES